MASRHPPRRITAKTTRRQESAEKNYSKNYQASRICREELQQELPGIKNPLRRHSKNYQASRICREEIQQELPGVKNPPRRRTEEENGVKTFAEKKSSPGGGVVFKTSGPASVVFKRAVDDRCWM